VCSDSSGCATSPPMLRMHGDATAPYPNGDDVTVRKLGRLVVGFPTHVVELDSEELSVGREPRYTLPGARRGRDLHGQEVASVVER